MVDIIYKETYNVNLYYISSEMKSFGWDEFGVGLYMHLCQILVGWLTLPTTTRHDFIYYLLIEQHRTGPIGPYSIYETLLEDEKILKHF